ncbi:MAG TPA: methyltransferase domain-containing protein [Ktedonobacterales bacterium]|nr:methyltransferase domain-containing protein [Ktedonobacterales bacterium]
MTTRKRLDRAKLDAFSEKAFRDLSGAYVVTMCILGDRLGLFRHLAAPGPATSAELAERAHINQRYAQEWLSALACAGYVDYDPASQRFSLPPEHAAVLADEGGAFFVGGDYEELPALWGVLDPLAAAFRAGGGVAQSAYHDSMYRGMDRNAVAVYDHALVQKWIPTLPDVQAALERGIEVADIGCGAGRVLIKLAQAFPQSRYIGYDAYEPGIALARQNAEAAGVAERVRFETLDASKGIPGQYNLITTFLVIHDAADPRGLLRAIRAALKPGGTYLCSEINTAETLEENAGPMGAFIYSTSVLYCMTVSLAEGGAGMGTAGMPPSKVRELCAEAGFGSVRLLPIENPFRNVFEVML